MASPRLVSVRNAFISGLFLLAPLVVTVWALQTIIDIVGGNVSRLFLRFLPDFLQRIPLVWEILSTLVVIILVTLLGYISRIFLGKFLLGGAERIVQSIPGISGVYNTVKQIVDTFSSQDRNLFNKVVLVQFPRVGCYAIGFLTNRAQGEPQARTTEELWTIFVPTTPNPTSGFLVLLPKREIIELDMSVGDGMKLVISGGTVVPPWPAPSSAAVAVANPAVTSGSA